MNKISIITFVSWIAMLSMRLAFANDSLHTLHPVETGMLTAGAATGLAIEASAFHDNKAIIRAEAELKAGLQEVRSLRLENKRPAARLKAESLRPAQNQVNKLKSTQHRKIAAGLSLLYGGAIGAMGHRVLTHEDPAAIQSREFVSKRPVYGVDENAGPKHELSSAGAE